MSSLSWLGYVCSWFQFDPLNIPSYTVPFSSLSTSTSSSTSYYEEYDENEKSDASDDDSRPPIINKKGSHPAQSQSQQGRVRTKFGQRVLWLERSHGGYHITANELEKYRTIGDRPIDRIVQLLRDEKTNQGNGSAGGLGPGDDLLEMMKEATEKIKRIEKKKKQPQQQQQQQNSSVADDSLPLLTTATTTSSISTADIEMASFYQSVSTLPPWVEIEQLRRGQEVYLAYLPAISMSLYYRSLIAGFSIPKIAAVIRATAYLAPPSRPDQVMQRLLDTGEFTACIGGGLGVEALLPGGLGWQTALHVRFLHAKVRFAILDRNKKKKHSSRSWNVEELGVPINQEDMAATLLAFSTNVLMGVSLLAGRAVSDREQRDYLALWRYVGWLLGVDTDHSVGVTVNVESSTASASASSTTESEADSETESNNNDCDTNDNSTGIDNSNSITVGIIGSSTSPSTTESESDNDDGETDGNSNENNNSNSIGSTVGVIGSSTSSSTTESTTESETRNDDCETNNNNNDINNSNIHSIGNNDTNNSNGINMVPINTGHLHHPLPTPQDLFELPPLDPCGPGNAKYVEQPNVIDNSSGMFSSMIFHLLEPDDSSKEVAHHLLKACVRTSPFYFRAMNCRRMIGNDLADALGLPYHPNKWTRRRIWLFSTIELLLVRIYTLIPMYLPFFVRRRIVQWHTQALRAFHEQWMQTHHSKMARAMQRKELPSVLDHNDDDNDNKKKKKKKNNVDATTEDVNDTTTTGVTARSVCPFAMMAKPK